MPKVVHVVRKFEPAEWGGTETHLVALVRELVALGWECEVHAPGEAGTQGRPLVEAGASFHTFRARYPYLGMSPAKRAALVAAGGNLVSVDELARLSLRRADILHVHTLGRLGGVVRTAARLRGRPYAVTLHGPVRAYADVAKDDAKRRARGMIDLGAPFGLAVGARRVVQDADLVYVLNKAEQDAWRASRSGRHLQRVAHGVDLEPAAAETITQARSRVPGLGDAPYAVVVARVDRAKGQDVAIRAFAEAAPPDHHLVIVGSVSDPSFDAELRRIVEALEPDVRRRVHLVGGLPPELARAMLAGARLALVPSRSEPFGIVLLEAWAEGTAALFSDVGGMSDIAQVTGGTFGLVEPGDASRWASRLREALQDSATLQAEAAAVQERVARHFSWSALAKTIAQGYERVCRRS